MFTGRRTAMYFKTREYETYREERTGKNSFSSSVNLMAFHNSGANQVSECVPEVFD